MNACNSIAVATAMLAFALAAGDASAGEPDPEPTALQSFVANPNVIVDFEQWVGSVASGDAKVSVTALAAHDTADPARRMRGLRLTMEDNAGSDSAHLDESQSVALARGLAEVEGGKSFMRTELDAPYRVMGTASCWMPKRPVRILCPSYRIGPDWTGMLLAVYGGRGFDFPDRKPAELAALLERGVAVLESQRTPP